MSLPGTPRVISFIDSSIPEFGVVKEIKKKQVVDPIELQRFLDSLRSEIVSLQARVKALEEA